MHHQPTPTLAVLGDSPFHTHDTDPADVAVLGELASSHMSSDRVAHLDRDSPPPGGALPSTHTPHEASGRSMASTTGQRPPGPLSFTANNRTATAAVVVMTSVVIALTVTCISGIIAGSVNWTAVVAPIGVGVVSLGGIAAGPVMRWTTRRDTRPLGSGGIR